MREGDLPFLVHLEYLSLGWPVNKKAVSNPQPGAHFTKTGRSEISPKYRSLLVFKWNRLNYFFYDHIQPCMAISAT
jgi:hypothetical protein